MNIILAPDSYKGSLSALEAAKTMKRAITDIDNGHLISMKPMADGGEGTMDAMLASSRGRKVVIQCAGATGEKIESYYAMLDSHTAVIELAAIAGLVQVPKKKRNPDYTTTFGIGEAILHALNRGCTSIIIGLGGSATNDGGLGMLQALGVKAWDERGNELGGFGNDLQQVSRISFTDVDPRVYQVEMKVACDVDNPLCGNRGASVVFGPQKGASVDQIPVYDKALDHYGNLVEAEVGKSLKKVPGAGAAGGTGFAFLSIGAELVSGAELMAKAMKLEDDIKQADLVFTGEGQSDEQTMYGKAPGYVAQLAKKYKVPVILLSGSLTGDIEKLQDRFSGCFSIINKPLTLEECIEHAQDLLYGQTKQIMYLMESLKK
ncbi:glycerate kinase [Oceanobacillus halophilus]|uniref:Glycerate kinase n=1 Tax=Oceanobacillus halophilus TaxID=930130 RepID=A0A495A7Z9_9BACI|nr:glycerate kinase [Oceanobacillus halophilus]RKQ35868.1 glycerate kinase [Oceanobacillus halophilus]